MTTDKEIRTEAAIWAEGTRFTADDIVRAYRAYLAECEEKGADADDIQTFCVRDLEIPNEESTDDGRVEELQAREYRIALAKADGSWDVIEAFEVADDAAANAYAEEHHADVEWYVIDAEGRNINGGRDQ